MASAASVVRRFKVVVCGACSCQVHMIDADEWNCSCCGVIADADVHEIVVTADVPFALIEAARNASDSKEEE